MRKDQCGLTEERLSNKRFRKIEDAIVRVFFKHKGRASVWRLSSEVGVARRTFYCHHKTEADVICDYEKYAYKKYDKVIRKYLRKDSISVRGLYRRTLIFIWRERRIFKIFIQARDKEIFAKMVGRLRGRVGELSGLGGNTKDIYNIYSGEIAEIFFMWGREGFCKDKVDEVLDDIMQMTSVMRVNLTKLNLYHGTGV